MARLHFANAALVVGFDDRMVYVLSTDENRVRKLNLVGNGGESIGLFGIDRHHGLLTISQRTLDEYAGDSWAERYLLALLEGFKKRFMEAHPGAATEFRFRRGRVERTAPPRGLPTARWGLPGCLWEGGAMATDDSTSKGKPKRGWQNATLAALEKRAEEAELEFGGGCAKLKTAAPKIEKVRLAFDDHPRGTLMLRGCKSFGAFCKKCIPGRSSATSWSSNVRSPSLNAEIAKNPAPGESDEMVLRRGRRGRHAPCALLLCAAPHGRRPR